MPRRPIGRGGCFARSHWPQEAPSRAARREGYGAGGRLLRGAGAGPGARGRPDPPRAPSLPAGHRNSVISATYEGLFCCLRAGDPGRLP